MTDESQPKARQRSRPKTAARPAKPLDRAKQQRLVLLILENKTQAAIAAHFGVDARTIRNWQKKIDLKELGLIDDFHIKAEVNRKLVFFQAQAGKLAERLRKAEADGDEKQALKVLVQQQKLEEQRDTYLRNCGFYNHVGDHLPKPHDPAAEQASILHSALLQLTVEEGDEPEEASNDNAD